MFKHILIPSDGSELSQKAAKAGVALAKVLRARLTGFVALDEYPASPYADDAAAGMPSPEQFAARQERHARGFLSVLTREAHAAGVSCATKFAVSGSPYAAIIQVPKKSGCDLILMASHGGRGIGGLVLGSETNKVLVHSKIPVLVYR